jgi:AAA+ ATPase superfamily predicted ATPase
VGDEREPPLQRSALAVEISALLPGFDQVDYPDWSSLLQRWWREALPGSILTLDEFPYLVKASPELPSLVQRLFDHNRDRRVHLVICGSSQRMMQGLVLDASAPLYGRAQEILPVRPLEAAWIAKALPFSQAIDQLQAYSIWGGIPRYWELAADYQITWDAVRDLILDPLGVLHSEPRRLLLDDIRETAQVASMLALIGQGCNRLSEIAARLAKPAPSLTRPLQRLLELGFVRREQPFGVLSKNSKKTLYRIDDPFLAFWFRYVEPNRSRLEAGILQSVLDGIVQDYPHHCGAVWEELVRQSVARLPIADLQWLPAQRWWGAGADKKPLELDVVTQSVDGQALFIGEVKLTLQQNQLDAVEKELARKLARLPLVKNYKHVHTGIFVAKQNELQTQPSQLVFADEVLTAMQ